MFYCFCIPGIKYELGRLSPTTLSPIMAEMMQSLRIIEQCLNKMPASERQQGVISYHVQCYNTKIKHDVNNIQSYFQGDLFIVHTAVKSRSR